MNFGTVIGAVVSTAKEPLLIGKKLLIVQPTDPRFENSGAAYVAVDTVGAGSGDRVLIAKGSPARNLFDSKAPIDAAIVAIIDSVEMD